MSTSRYQLSLLLFGCLSASTLLVNRPALAQSTTEAEPAAVEVPSNNHSCYEQTDEQPRPLGELKQAMLETVEIMARASDSAQKKVNSLLGLSRYYACRGQVARAESLMTESLEIANEIDDSHAKANVLSQIISAYGRERNYEAVRNIVDTQEDESVRELLINSSVYILHNLATEEDQIQIEELFPELISILNEINEQQWETEPEISPVAVWMYTLAEQFYELSDVDKTEDLASLISEQIDVVENFPDPYSQSYGYAILSTYALGHGSETQARNLVETAVQRVEGLEAPDPPDFILSQGGGYSLNALLGTVLIYIEEYERGVSLIRDTENHGIPFAKIEQMLGAVALLSDAEQFELAAEVASDTEAVARMSGEAEYFLGRVALAYFQSNQIAKGQSIIQELLAIEDIELDAVSFQISQLAAQLIEAGQANLAEEIVQKATSPTLKVKILAAMAHEYYYGGDSDSSNNSEEDKERSLALFSRAIIIAQRADNNVLQQDMPIETDGAANTTDWNESEGRYDLIIHVLNYTTETGVIQTLIELIEDETLRSRIAQRYSAIYGGTSDEPEITAEQALRTEAIDAAKAGNFQQAVDTLSQIESSTIQIRALLNIAKCYVSNETSLDEPTRLSLEALQQQYQ